MSHDFERWNNEPAQRSRHAMPPDVERVLRSGERHKRRKLLVVIVALMLTAAFVLWTMLTGRL